MRALLAGGGTGGHLVPALNIARELIHRNHEADIRFVGTARGIENRIIPEEGFPLELMPVLPFSRRPSIDWLRFPVALLGSISKGIAIIRRSKIQVVVATGGYIAGPALLAGWLSRVPVILCEQNSFPGLTVRVGSLFAKVVALGLPGAKPHLWRRDRAFDMGNPVGSIVTERSKENILADFGLSPGRPVILVTGGSQGAQRINDAVESMLEGDGLDGEIQLIWQTGEGKDESARRRFADMDNIAIVPFIRTMAEAYSVADLVVARCGALTLSEIAAFGLPSILVPYPFAAGDHQRKNARMFERSGAAKVMENDAIGGVSLSKAIESIIWNEESKKRMSEAARRLGRPKALKAITDIVERLTEEK